MRSRSYWLFSWLFASALLGAAVYPCIDRWIETASVRGRLDRLRSAPAQQNIVTAAPALTRDFSPDPALLVRVATLGPLLSGWQTIGGCGAGSGTGGGAGLKWIGRGVSGGLFNVQSQATYTRITSSGKREQHMFVNTLITRELSEKWIFGTNIPFVYKYLTDYFFPDPFSPGIDVSNGGLGDVSVQLTRKLGRINATTFTTVIGFPTGAWETRYRGKMLLQQQQLGFGMLTGNLVLDHAMDQIWGVIVVGGVASWRGGQNIYDNYRAPSATTYAYSGYFLGPFVPAIGLAATGFSGHDRDQTLEQMTPLFGMTGNVSLEWSTDWIAVLAGASMPYQYDGFRRGTNAVPRSPWGLGPWTVALGLSLSPF